VTKSDIQSGSLRAAAVRRLVLVAVPAVLGFGVSAASAANPVSAPSSSYAAPVTGTAIADYWDATPAEYQATAEAVLDAGGAGNLRHAGVLDAAVVELLRMFGGAGAPQDLVRRRTGEPVTPAE
jgi:hypothetical protein